MRLFHSKVDPSVHDDFREVPTAVGQVLVEAFVSQVSIEALDKAVLLRLAMLDVRPFAELRFFHPDKCDIHAVKHLQVRSSERGVSLVVPVASRHG